MHATRSACAPAPTAMAPSSTRAGSGLSAPAASIGRPFGRSKTAVPGSWSAARRGLRCALLLCLALGVADGAAQPLDAAARLQALDAEVLEAYRRGAYAEGAAAAERALALSRKALGPRHPNTLRIMDTFAALRRVQGRYGEAEPLHREALRLGREVLGPRHPDTLASMNNLVSWF